MPGRLIERFVGTVPSGRLAVVRVLTIAYALVWITVRTGYWRDLADLPGAQWKPVAFADAIGPLGPTAVTLIAVATFAAGAVAITGRAWRLSAPVLAVGFLVLTTLGASWGAILHTEHLVALHLLVLAAGPAGRTGSETVGWSLRVMSAVTVTTYFVSGLAKFRFGGGLAWLDGDRLLRLVAHDNLRKRLLGDRYSPFAEYVVGHPWLFQVAAVTTIVVELGAPLALFAPRRVRYAWVGMAWSFHVGVLALMAIFFPYPISGVAYASMLPVERLSARWPAWRASANRLSVPGAVAGAGPVIGRERGDDLVGDALRIVERDERLGAGNLDNGRVGKDLGQAMGEAREEEPVGGAPHEQHRLGESAEAVRHAEQFLGVDGAQEAGGVGPYRPVGAARLDPAPGDAGVERPGDQRTEPEGRVADRPDAGRADERLDASGPLADLEEQLEAAGRELVERVAVGEDDTADS